MKCYFKHKPFKHFHATISMKTDLTIFFLIFELKLCDDADRDKKLPIWQTRFVKLLSITDLKQYNWIIYFYYLLLSDWDNCFGQNFIHSIPVLDKILFTRLLHGRYPNVLLARREVIQKWSNICSFWFVPCEIALAHISLSVGSQLQFLRQQNLPDL